jgi:hypothetical protein
MAKLAKKPAKQVIEQAIRDWRYVKAEYDKAKPALKAGKTLEAEEREQRAKVGGILACDKVTLTVDGETVIYERSQRDNGFDFAGAWAQLQETAPPALRKQMDALLKPNPPVTLHKLTTE